MRIRGSAVGSCGHPERMGFSFLVQGLAGKPPGKTYSVFLRFTLKMFLATMACGAVDVDFTNDIVSRYRSTMFGGFDA